MTAQKGLGILQHPPPGDGFEHRLSGAWGGAIQKGSVHFISVYLKDSEGMSPTNMAILDELATFLGKIKGPWICGGDWNLIPQVLKEANWHRIVDGVIKAPIDNTCNGSTYDFFGVHKSLDACVLDTFIISDVGTKPHWPCRILLKGSTRHKAVRRLVRPDKVPAGLPAGPLPRPCHVSAGPAVTSRSSSSALIPRLPIE